MSAARSAGKEDALRSVPSIGLTQPDFERHAVAGERFLHRRPGRFVHIDQPIRTVSYVVRRMYRL